ncbi:LuxR C-terminal-related transcriptional regulator [Streptomyces sp. NPDC003717]|uniref:LuxR family transcriptional regulator AbsR2 n=1 Tax=Streptomyces sp. NPDC003717 TaxID=3154276 RepID=UPI0033B4DF8A
MTSFPQDATTPQDPSAPWPFTGRAAETELVRRGGVVVTGPSGRGKTRLVSEALHGTEHVRAIGTPECRGIPFAAFAHLLPEPVTLHGAVRLLSGVRLLFVDDAHLLDDASAALVHQLAAHGRTRLVVVAADDAPAPGAVSRLWTGELLPRLALEPLRREESAELLAAALGHGVDPLTADRLHRLCGGDLRLLRELVRAVAFAPVDGTEERAWRGPVPVTAAVREHAARVLRPGRTAERAVLDALAFAEPLPLSLTPPADTDALDLTALAELEAEGLVTVDAHGAARLAHPLHGPVLRAAAGRLRARRPAPAPDRCGPALAAEAAALRRAVARDDVRELPAPVGEWLAAEGAPLPAGYAALRARFARLGGRLREAAAWAREGLRTRDDPECRGELALAEAQSGLPPTGHLTGAAAVWTAAARGDLDGAVRAAAPYDAVRLGTPDPVPPAGRLTGVFAAHADALVRRDGPALDEAAERLRRRGFLLFAAEAHAQAVGAHRDPAAARASRSRAAVLARRCQGARTPALTAVTLGELTARQRQIVSLAAAGLSNRQIAERLTLSVRTVGNHLHAAYTRLGTGDRDALPRLVEPPTARSA